MIDVSAMEIVGMLLQAAAVLRAAWLATHPAVHHAALQPAHWADRMDRATHAAQHRA